MFMPYTIICFTMYNTIYAMFQRAYMIYSPLEHGMTYGIFTLRHGRFRFALAQPSVAHCLPTI